MTVHASIGWAFLVVAGVRHSEHLDLALDGCRQVTQVAREIIIGNGIRKQTPDQLKLTVLARQLRRYRQSRFTYLLPANMAPAIKRKALLPVLEAIAEALMPSQPAKASDARKEGENDMANLYATSGKQQNNDMHQACQPCCRTAFSQQCLQGLQSFVLQILARMEKNLTAESQREIFLYVSHPELLSDVVITTMRMPYAVMTLACSHLCHAVHYGLATAILASVQHYAAALSVCIVATFPLYDAMQITNLADLAHWLLAPLWLQRTDQHLPLRFYL